MVDIWSIGKGDVSKMRFLFYSILKKLLLAIEFTTTKRITSAAAALTYSTLLAIVPIFAVVFGIARGFGYNKYIARSTISGRRRSHAACSAPSPTIRRCCYSCP